MEDFWRIIENAVKLLVKKGEKLKEIVMYVGPHQNELF